jgi:hypothetical protein
MRYQRLQRRDRILISRAMVDAAKIERMTYGGVTLDVSSVRSLWRPGPGAMRYGAFCGLSGGDADVEVSIRDSLPVSQERMEQVFDAGAWRAWRTPEGESWFSVGDRGPHSWTLRIANSPVVRPLQVALFWHGGEGAGAMPHPLAYPLDQVLIIHLLPRFGGILVHAAGIVDDSGKGWLCAGRSGAGKTTISLAADRAGRRVLSDDRVIVRDCGGEFRIYGTPWPGDGGFARNESAPLAGVRFITKSDRNATVPLTAAAAAARLFPVCSIPWYDRECADRCVELLDRLVSTVPCAVLECTPDERAVQALESGVPVVPFVRTPS